MAAPIIQTPRCLRVQLQTFSLVSRKTRDSECIKLFGKEEEGNLDFDSIICAV